MRTVRRLRLRFFASSTEFPQSYGFHITVLSTNLLVALSKPSHPQRISLNRYLVEVEGIEPSSRTLFSLLHTAIL